MEIKIIIKYLNELKKDFPDLLIKTFKTGLFKNITIISTDSLSSSDRVNDFILKTISNYNSFNKKNISISSIISNYIPSINEVNITKKEDIIFYLYNGFTIIIDEKSKKIFAFETRSQLDRGITESSSEPTIKGAKDSFTENYNKNIGLIRKRIKTDKLILKQIKLGTYTSSTCGIMYLNDKANKDLVNNVIKKVSNIKTEAMLDINYIKELLNNENNSTFPTILSTEKPVNACRYITDGRVILIMENSPCALILPTLLLDFFKNSEDYNQKSFFASFLRIIRFFAFLLAILTPAFYISLTTYEQAIIPTSLLINFATQREGVPFPAIVEAIILLIAFEILNEGDSRVPSLKTSSLSILGALILGEAAVSAGVISPIMVIIIALTSICTLLFSYQDIQASIRYWRYILIFVAAFFGGVGIAIGLTIMLIKLCEVNSFNIPYLVPYSPFKKNKLNDALIKKKGTNL